MTSRAFLTPSVRFWLAFFIAPFAPVLLNALFLWPLFVIALVVGIACAYALTLLFAVPLVLALRNQNKLRLKWIVLAAGVLALIPDLAISLAGVVFGGMNMLKENGIWLVYEGRYTWAGLAYYFAIRPFAYWLSGAVGGLLFWSIAFGWKSPPMPSNPLMQPTGQEPAGG